MVSEHSGILDLNEKVKMLQLENEYLTERAEESMMLGLISEIIQPLHSRNEILDACLERVALLKRLSLTAFAILDGESLNIIRSYLTVSHEDINAAVISLDSSMVRKLESGETCFDHELLVKVLRGHGIDFSPKQALLIPISNNEQEKIIFIFADSEPDADRLTLMIPMLSQVADLLVSTIHHRELLEKYRLLNAGLDRKVDERTQALNEAMNALSESESRFRNLVEQAADAFFVVDMKGRFVDVNMQACKSLGFSRNELVQMGVADIDHDFTDEMAAKVFSQGTQMVRGSHIRKDGSVFPVEINISAMEMDNNQYMLAIARDISALKEMEDKFHQAQKMEAMGTLVGGIAHDFNNMLAAMSGTIYLAKRHVDQSDDIFTYLERIETLSGRAADIVSQLMVFSRKRLINIQPAQLSEIFKKAIELGKVSIPENIIFESVVDSESMIVVCDETQIQQLLMNLINNARDAVEHATNPQISVSLKLFNADEKFLNAHPDLSGGRFSLLSVTDNGHGIPEKEMQSIFEPFYTTKGVGKGTGLGLSMVYGTVQSHHGAIDVDSKQGVGATFSIYLPLCSELELSEKDISKETPSGKGETILLVDDEPDIIQTGKKVLESFNYNVFTALNGLGALAVFNKHQNNIDLVISDVVMPEMGGKELAGKLMKISPDIPILFSTGYDKDEVLKGSGLPKNYLVISKPYHPEDLIDMVQKLINGN